MSNKETRTINVDEWKKEKRKMISEMPEVKKIAELEQQAIKALDEACRIAEEIGISRYFGISPIWQLYACELSDSKLFQEFKTELAGAINSETNTEISTDDAVEILSYFDEFQTGEWNSGGWQHSAVC